MADSSKKSPVVPPEVRELIEESQKIQGWVERLAEHADEARPEVYRRVLSDYQGRLQKVTGRLVKHRADLVSNLEGHQGEVESLARDRDTHSAELEEARLRHAVGEYSDDDWSERREGIEESISEIDARLSVEKEAVEELSGIISSIGEGGTPVIEEPAATNGAADARKTAQSKPAAPSDRKGSAAATPKAEAPATPEAEAPAAKTGKTAAEEPEPEEPADPAPAAESHEAAGAETEAGAEETKSGASKSAKEPAAAGDASAKTAGTERGADEPEGGDYLDELEFLESLSLDEAERFDAVSAMLDEDEAGNGKKES